MGQEFIAETLIAQTLIGPPGLTYSASIVVGGTHGLTENVIQRYNGASDTVFNLPDNPDDGFLTGVAEAAGDDGGTHQLNRAGADTIHSPGGLQTNVQFSNFRGGAFLIRFDKDAKRWFPESTEYYLTQIAESTSLATILYADALGLIANEGVGFEPNSVVARRDGDGLSNVEVSEREVVGRNQNENVGAIPFGDIQPRTEKFTATAGQTAFVLALTPASLDKTYFYMRGLRYESTVDYSVAGNTVSWTDAKFVMKAGDPVTIDYYT